MAVSDPHDFHSEQFPDDEYVMAAKDPAELADVIDTQARASLIAEAVDHYWGGWASRRQWFIGDLDRLESVWFG